MALTTRLEFRQSQALVMTPQLMQAIKLLQLSNLDLAAYVDDELEKNPLLERASEGDAPPADAAGDGASNRPRRTANAPDGEAAAEWMGDNLETSRGAMEDQLGTRLDNVFPEDSDQSASSARNDDASATYSEWASVGSGGRDDAEYNLEAFVSAERTLPGASRGAACARGQRSGAAHHRPAPDR